MYWIIAIEILIGLQIVVMILFTYLCYRIIKRVEKLEKQGEQ